MDQWGLSRALAAQHQQQQQSQQGHSQAGQYAYPSGSYSGIQAGGASAAAAAPYGSQLYSQQSYGQAYGQQMLGQGGKVTGASDDYLGSGSRGAAAGFSGGTSVTASTMHQLESKYAIQKSELLGGAGQKGSDYLLAQYTNSQAPFATADGQSEALKRYSDLQLDQQSQALRQQQLMQTSLRQGVTPATLDSGVRSQADYLRSSGLRVAGTGEYAGRELLGSAYGVTRAEEAALLASQAGLGSRSGVGILPFPSQVNDPLGSLTGSRNLLGSVYPAGTGYSAADLGHDYGTPKSLAGGIGSLSDFSGIGSVRYDDRLDDRLALRQELDRRDDDRRRRERSRERERERERSWERERERAARERERERERRERERARERERERDRELRRREKSPPPRMPPPRRAEERPAKKFSPRRDPPPRLASPVRSKRRDYLCKVETYSLVETERDLLSLIRRYPRLFIASDFSKAVACWMNNGAEISINQPVSFEHDAVDVEEESDPKEAPVAEAPSEEVKAPKGSVVWSAKVMLMSGLSNECLKDLLSDRLNEDKPLHIHNLLKFVILRKDRSALMAVGGTWDKVLDGGDPSEDDSVLLRTAIRCTKESTELDLTGVSNWTRFMEVHYNRIGDNGVIYKEITVLYLPDLSGCIPSLDSWQLEWKQRKEARLKREAAQKEKDEKAAQTKEALKSCANGIKGEKDGKLVDLGKKEKDDKKDKKEEKKEDKKDKKEKEEKKEEKKDEKKDKKEKEEKKTKEAKKEKDGKEDTKESELKKDDKKDKERENNKKDRKEKADKKEKKDEKKEDAKEEKDKKEKEEEEKVEKDSKDTKHKMSERKDRGKGEGEAPLVPGLFITTKRTTSSKVRSLSISLDGLLDYDERDKDESTFELSLFAEFFQEMLQYRFGCCILTALENLHKVVSARKKEDKKRGRHDENDVQAGRLKKKSKFSDKAGGGEGSEEDDGKASKNGKDSTDKTIEEGSKEEEAKKEDPKVVKDIDAAMQEASLINFEDLEDEGQDESETLDADDGDENDEPQDEGSKHRKAEGKTVVDEELLKAYRYFDKNRVGFLKAEDLRRLLHILGKFLTSKWVKDIATSALLECKSRDDRIMYSSLVEKEVE